MSLRLSFGAGRGRLIQQVLIESALVAAAATLGLLFAGPPRRPSSSMLASPEDPVSLELRVDWRLLAFVGALTLLITRLRPRASL